MIESSLSIPLPSLSFFFPAASATRNVLQCRSGQAGRCTLVAELGTWVLHQMKLNTGAEEEGAACVECGSSGDGGRMLLCDLCNAGWHMYCLPEALAIVPEGAWTCPSCIIHGRELQEDNFDDEEDDNFDVACLGCGTKDREQDMLLCDGNECRYAWHIDCLPQPLDQVPPSDCDWLCPSCEGSTTSAFG